MAIKASLQDIPIQPTGSIAQKAKEIDEDTIGILPYAQALAKFIEECDTPMTVGLQGDWGIGKTSLMNLIKGILSHKNCVKIDFTKRISLAKTCFLRFFKIECIFDFSKIINEILEKLF